MAISFEGRELTQEEEYQIIETITENTSISIICIVDNDESHADLVKQQIDAYYDSVSGREGEFYRGTLRSGQVLESVSSVVIVGDVNPGAKIISQGNIVVLGALKGNAYAGAAGDSNCFIVALEMDPIQIHIIAAYPACLRQNLSSRRIHRNHNRGRDRKYIRPHKSIGPAHPRHRILYPVDLPTGLQYHLTGIQNTPDEAVF